MYKAFQPPPAVENVVIGGDEGSVELLHRKQVGKILFVRTIIISEANLETASGKPLQLWILAG
jgi:hypothetical protein